jgi:hypothetical protein
MQRARRLVWVTGQPGCGKTTLGNAMKATKGWLHYDGDMYTHGGHPIQDTGIPTAEMLAARDPELTKVYLEMGEKGFNAVFRGERPPLQVWIPFHDLMCADVLRRWEENPGASIIVTQAVYPRELRAYISSKIPFLEWVVMDDVAQGSVNRKLQQIKDAAAAEGQSMAQYLSKFGDQWKDVWAQLYFCTLTLPFC